MNNLEEMNTFLETYGFPRLKNKVIQNMLSPITNKQIEILIKKTLKKKRKKENPRPESYPDEFCNTFKEGLIFTFLILFQGN